MAIKVIVGEAERGVEACGASNHFGWEGAAGRQGAAGRSLPGWSFASDDSQGNVSSGPLYLLRCDVNWPVLEDAIGE